MGVECTFASILSVKLCDKSEQLNIYYFYCSIYLKTKSWLLTENQNVEDSTKAAVATADAISVAVWADAVTIGTRVKGIGRGGREKHGAEHSQKANQEQLHGACGEMDKMKI